MPSEIKPINIGKKRIDTQGPSFVIAEVACGHEGKKDVVDKLIDIASDAGVDAIKFHHHYADDYITKDHPLFEFIKNINFPVDDWKTLYNKAREKGMCIISMPNDVTSLSWTEKLGADTYYLHSANLGDFIFIKEMAKTKKPIMIGTGATTFDEIREVISLIKGQGNTDIILMHGYQAYPTKLEENHLRMISTIKKEFGTIVGFCDHTDGGSEIAKILPIVAVAFGARVIEKHFTIDRKLKMIDYESALDPSGLKEFMQNLRDVEKTLGSDKPHPFSEDEKKYRNLVKKSIVAKHDVKAGKNLELDDIAFKRSKEQGLSAFEYKKVIGKKTKKIIKQDDRVLLEDLE